MKREDVLAVLIRMRKALEPYKVSRTGLVRKVKTLATAINNNLTR
jgi:hypothetical protein